ncbi:MAG TPA: hypothetical protein VHS59_10540, partial [Bacillota bacterium]|nr:hypothetical protein [Bacillota bacterium]
CTLEDPARYLYPSEYFCGPTNYKGGVIVRFMKHHRHKMDLGTMDFPQTGWWLWHTAAITGVLALGKMMAKRRYD